MKKLIKKGLVIVVMFTSILSFSNEPKLNKDGKVVVATKVSYDNVKEGSFLQIKDNYGQILYNEFIEKAGIHTKNFDLTNLPDALYYFELDNQIEIIITPFTVKDNIAVLIKDEEYKIDKPEIIVKDEHVYILNMSPAKFPWKINVYYEGDDLAYSEKLKDNKLLSRLYDFSNSKKGNYMIVLKSEGRTYRTNINI